MRSDRIKVITLSVLAGLVLCLTQACAGPQFDMPNKDSVAAAYETSDAVVVSPYTRTIFSSTNF